jgi:hypothetical protein
MSGYGLEDLGPKRPDTNENAGNGLDLTSLTLPPKQLERSSGYETVATGAEEDATHDARAAANRMQTILANKDDQDRGDKALELYDIANGRDARLTKNSPSARNAFSTTLARYMRDKGIDDDPAYVTAYTHDYRTHQQDAMHLDRVVGNVGQDIADLVKNEQVAAAVDVYDQAIGAANRRYVKDQNLETHFIQKLAKDLQGRDGVWNALGDEMSGSQK